MAELVDAHASGTCGQYVRGSSSLLQGTKKNLSSERFFYALDSALFHCQRVHRQSWGKSKIYKKYSSVLRFFNAQLSYTQIN